MKTLEQKTQKLNEVCLGVVVDIVVNGYPQTWEIVKIKQSDIKNGKLPEDAPLVRLIWGAKPGDIVKGKIGERDFLVEVKGVATT